MSQTETSILLMPPTTSKYGVEYSHEEPIVIAPLTLKLSKYVGTLSLEEASKKLQATGLQKFTAPVEYYDVTGSKGKNGGGLTGDLTRVLNQGQCGSCWAFSQATAISDCFTKTQLKSNSKLTNGIKISPSSFLNVSGATLPGQEPFANGCQGGDIVSTALYLENNSVPLVLDTCSDYSWYLTPYIKNNVSKSCSTCNNTMLQYQNLGNNQEKGPKCLQPPKNDKGQHYQFRINRVVTSSNTSISNSENGENTVLPQGTDDWTIISDPTKLNTALKNRLMMQNFLIKYGSFPIGLTVFAGFYSGGGVYSNSEITSSLGGDSNISWVNKTGDGKMKVNVYVQDPENDNIVKGGHALTCVGWDYSKDVHDRAITMLQKWFGVSTADINTVVTSLKKSLSHDFPLGFHFLVRNSWGENWGSGGYFGVADYPSNPLVQFTYPFQSYANNRPTSNKLAQKFIDNNPAVPQPSGSPIMPGMFGTFCGLIPGEVCGGLKGDCKIPLDNYPDACSAGLASSKNTEPLFSVLDEMLPSKSSSLISGTNTRSRVESEIKADDATIAQWSRYLSEEAGKLKNRACIYSQVTENISPDIPNKKGYKNTAPKGLSTGAIIGIVISIIVVLLSIIFFTVH